MPDDKYPRNKLGIRILDDPKQAHRVSEPRNCNVIGHHGRKTGLVRDVEDDWMMGGWIEYQYRCFHCNTLYWRRGV